MNNKEGIIFKVQDYTENSRLLKVLTKDGIITINARGSQKLNSKDRILAQYLTLISFNDDKNSDFIYLNNGKLINDFSNIKKDYFITKKVNVIFEVLNKVIIEKEHYNKIYELTLDVLTSTNIIEGIISFMLKLTYILGYGMNFKNDGKLIKGFSINEGSIVYENSLITPDLSYEETVTLLKLTYGNIKELEPLTLLEKNIFEKFIYKYYLDKIELKLKSLE
ncbi:DNA repair protein RecO [Haploplasma modicum]|uniref:DNA repair protein RecO n=1 Tax=Haploplasma modicum TaxID=2150 RepID=UPI00214CF4C5|nr:DNA repair protein RecO [Haploplasma modicum]MCR1809021.1 DNA repair protein RecO [Haploplasma modicum]